MLHEAGHFGFAKAFKMKASQFFVGFGPTLWSFRRGETEYGVKAIPAGGFVKIIGMTPLEEVAPGDEARAFYRRPAPQRAVVLAAGSVVHFVIAFVLLLVVFSGIGTPTVTTTVADVSACVPTSATSAGCSAGDPTSPAAVAGVQAGDRIVAFNGRPVRSWTALTTEIRAAGGHRVTLVVDRRGKPVTLSPTIATAQRPSLTDPNRTERVGVLGVSPAERNSRQSIVSGLATSGGLFRDSVTGTFSALGKIPASIPKLFSANRGVNSPTSVVGIGRISGEVATARVGLADRIATFLLIIASLNIFVGIFNLLPLLPLDGGHLAVLGFEQARSRLYRLTGRADPGRVDLTKLLPAAYLVIALFVGLSLLLIAADIVNPIHLPQ